MLRMGGRCSVCGCPYLKFLEFHEARETQRHHVEQLLRDRVRRYEHLHAEGLLMLVCWWCRCGRPPVNHGRPWDQVVLACDTCSKMRQIGDLIRGPSHRIVCCRGCLRGGCTCGSTADLDARWVALGWPRAQDECRMCGTSILGTQPAGCTSNHEVQAQWMGVYQGSELDPEVFRCGTCGLFIRPDLVQCEFCHPEDEHVSELPSMQPVPDGEVDPGRGPSDDAGPALPVEGTRELSG